MNRILGDDETDKKERSTSRTTPADGTRVLDGTAVSARRRPHTADYRFGRDRQSSIGLGACALARCRSAGASVEYLTDVCLRVSGAGWPRCVNDGSWHVSDLARRMG